MADIIVNDVEPRRQYTASGGQTVFDFPIPFFATDDLTVWLTPAGQASDDTADLLILTTNYTVSGENTQDGGKVTLVVPATLGDVITIERIVDIERLADYQNSGDLLAETLNKEQDTEIFISQQLRQDVDRSMRRAKSSTSTADLTTPEPEALKVMRWKADLSGLENASSTEVFNGDAGDIPYNQGGTGATPTDVEKKLQERVSILDFGATADGVANDATALSNACATGKRVVIPSGIYKLEPSAGELTNIIGSFENIYAEDAVTIKLPATTYSVSSGDIMNLSAYSRNITLTGADVVSSTVSSIGSVTGSAGNWSVVVNVADGTGMAIGDYLDLYNVSPLALLSGDNSAASILREYPVKGEICNPTLNVGLITASSGGSSASFSNVVGTLSDYIKVGDLLSFKGHSRQVLTVGAGSVTIVGTWTESIASSGTFYVTQDNTGTVTTAGASTTITGSGTLFNTEANVGDMIMVDGQFRQITNIGGDTSITVDEVITIGSATKFTIVTGGVLHWGCHEITGVSANAITVTNKSEAKPPVNQVISGEATCIKTILENTGTGDGIVCEQGASISKIDNVVVVGDGVTTGAVGLLSNSRISAGVFGDITQQGYVSNVFLGENVGFVGWGTGMYIGYGCTVNARRGTVSGSTATQVWLAEGAALNGRRMTITGGAGIGCIVSAGATMLATEAVIAGNGADGLRRFNGATLYAEAPIFYANGGMNLRVVGEGGLGVSGGVSSRATNSGVYFQNAGGEIESFIFANNGREGVEAVGMGAIDASESWISGTSSATGSGYGVLTDVADIDVSESGIRSNTSTDIVATGLATIKVSGTNYDTESRNGGASLDVENTSWASYTPTVAPSGGSITSYTINNAEYIKRDNAIEVTVDVTIDDNGTGSGLLNISLPVTTTKLCAVAGVNTSTGEALTAYTSSSNFNILKYNVTYPVASGNKILVTGIYRL